MTIRTHVFGDVSSRASKPAHLPSPMTSTSTVPNARIWRGWCDFDAPMATSAVGTAAVPSLEAHGYGSEMVTYRIRWPWAVAASAPLPLILGVMTAVLIRPMWFAIIVEIAFIVLGARSVRAVRRRTLTISNAGLQVQRDKYAMLVRWDQVVGVKHRVHQLAIPVDELVLSGSELIARGSNDKPTTLPASLSAHPALKGIHISLYDKAWRDGPVGDHLQGLVIAGGLEP